MSERKITIILKNLDKQSYVEKCTRCDVCLQHNREMEKCPLIARIVKNITQTDYSINGSNLNIVASTYDHDFRRALGVARMAIDARCVNVR